MLAVVAAVTSVAASVNPAAADAGWQPPVHVRDGALFVAISCPSADFCAAFDSRGRAFLYRDGAWSAPTRVWSVAGLGHLGAVSCASAAFCMTVDANGDAESFDGTSWSSPTTVSGAGILTAVDCTSATRCFAGDSDGTIFRYGKHGWKSGQPVLAYVRDISCLGATFCMAVSDNESAIFDGTTWSDTATADPMPYILSVYCFTTQRCMAVDALSRYVMYRQGSWSHPHRFKRREPSTVGFSCGGASLCATVDTNGDAVLWNGQQFGHRQKIDGREQRHGGYAAVSCASDSFCMAVNWAGDAVEYTV